MIIRNNKMFETNSMFLNSDWYNEGNYIIDETTPEGQQMAQTYIENYPFVDIEHDGEFITRVIILDKPEKPPKIEGKEIQIIKNENGEWEYIYIDIPLTEVELLKEQIETSNQAITELSMIIGGMF